MVAFNFSAQFADDVASGKKTRTIRRTRHGDPGDLCQHYTGQRTKACRKLIERDPELVRVVPVTLTVDQILVGNVFIRGPAMNQFAKLDGFKNYAAMFEWFSKRYRTHIIDGYLHEWRAA